MAGPTPADKENAALEKRHWVCLTHACNNRCIFCHDAKSLDDRGGMIAFDQLAAEIRSGIERGAERLILSGGEPTIHPRFLELVALGKQAGYSWVQTVSNGRMFAYPGFARKALDAGLDEVTISMHGHTAALHDELVGVSGAFEQASRGLHDLLESGRVVVSVDVVLSALNLPELPDLLRFYLDMGVREFDLLWLVPFGRAWRNRTRLFVSLEQHASSLRDALALASEAGAVVWTNRLPAAALEGAEDLIQDPHKLHDEIRGRRQELEAAFNGDGDMHCRETDRCGQCFIQEWCVALERVRMAQSVGRHPGLSGRSGLLAPRKPIARSADLIRISAPSVLLAHRVWLDWRPDAKGLVIELEGPLKADPRSLDWGVDLLRVASSDPVCLDASLAMDGLALEVILDGASAPWVLRQADLLRQQSSRMVYSMRSFETLSETSRKGAEPRAALEALAGAQLAVQGLPLCVVVGARQLEEPIPTALSVFAPDGSIDLEAFTDHFIRDLYRVYSFRCSECLLRPECPGLPINHARLFGFGILRPASS